MLRRSYIIGILLLFIFILIASISLADEYTNDPGSYVIEKFKSHDIIFLGTTHKQQPILNFISDIIPTLHAAGVSYLCLEISSEQQNRIDHYIQTGEGLPQVKIEPSIDCPEYRSLLQAMRDLPPNNLVVPWAIDLPRSIFNEDISRDEYMAQTIAKLLKENTGTKILAVLGNLHVLKELDWEDHLKPRYRSIREYLTDLCPRIQMFSIVQVIGKNPEECDFTKTFAPIDGVIAFDCTQKFSGWKLGTLSVIAINETGPHEAFDGLIVY